MHTPRHQTFHFAADRILLHNPLINMEKCPSQDLNVCLYINNLQSQFKNGGEKESILNSIFSFKCMHAEGQKI